MPGTVDHDVSGPLLIALTFDTDADHFDQSLLPAGAAPDVTWRGVAEGIPAILDVARSYHDSDGNAARFTWFVRVDNQIKELHGDAAHLLSKHWDMWQRCIAEGDEIGWHPHLYRREGDEWVQEKDEHRLESAMVESFAALRARGMRPEASRIGEAYCSNGILAVLEKLEMRCDSTAMPGRVRQDTHRNIDWAGTPVLPYRPSRADYRRPGQPARKLVEIPMSLVPVRAEYDQGPFPRYVDLSFRTPALAAGLRDHIATAQMLVTMTHPSGVLSDLVERRHGLISFSIESFRANLDMIVELCRTAGRPFRFVTISEVREWAEEEAGVVGE